jgi:hypothetical protein
VLASTPENKTVLDDLIAALEADPTYVRLHRNRYRYIGEYVGLRPGYTGHWP